jgi:hypothetical protein
LWVDEPWVNGKSLVNGSERRISSSMSCNCLLCCLLCVLANVRRAIASVLRRNWCTDPLLLRYVTA